MAPARGLRGERRGRRSTPRATRSSSPSAARATRSPPRWLVNARSPTTRGRRGPTSACGWGFTLESRSPPRATSASASTVRPASARPGTAARCCSRMRRASSSRTTCRPTFASVIWAITGSRTSTARNASSSSTSRASRASFRRSRPSSASPPRRPSPVARVSSPGRASRSRSPAASQPARRGTTRRCCSRCSRRPRYPVLLAGGQEANALRGVDANAVGVVDAGDNEITSEIEVDAAPEWRQDRGCALGRQRRRQHRFADRPRDELRAGHDQGGQRPDRRRGRGRCRVGDERPRRHRLRIDPKTNEVVQRIGVGNGPASVAAGEGAIWVANAVTPLPRRSTRAQAT